MTTSEDIKKKVGRLVTKISHRATQRDWGSVEAIEQSLVGFIEDIYMEGYAAGSYASSDFEEDKLV